MTDVYDKIAEDLDFSAQHGHYLLCPKCRRKEGISRERMAECFRDGWPTCCEDQTMELRRG